VREKNLLVSVFIPAYNAARTIRATLDSALVQIRLTEEILMVDDGSTDQKWEIVKFKDDMWRCRGRKQGLYRPNAERFSHEHKAT
jgi:glycosyltransferase involved in cell wall biosynthesis